jgi:putative oxidoreductase
MVLRDAGTRANRRPAEGTKMSDAVESRKLVFPGLAGLYERFSPYSYALMRFSAGAVLVPHGVQKVLFKSVGDYAGIIGGQGLPMPMLLAYLTFFVELVGAACLAVGLFTRLAALSILIEMSVIITVFQWQYGYFWTNKGIEYALLWWLLCLAIFFRGGGYYSLDRLLGKEI